MNAIVGHERNRAYFERVLAKGTPAHAYLFYGPAHVGKKTLALAIAQALLCSSDPLDSRRGMRSTPSQGCGACYDCQAVASATHPDVIMISADEGAIGIDSIHNLTGRFSQTPWRGNRNIAIIDSAEQMTREAQAALLKTLEEPSPGTVLFLIAQTRDALLPTIRSRSVPLGFSLLNDGAMASLLAGVSPTRRAAVLGLARGRPSALVRLLADEEAFETARHERVRLKGLMSSDLAEQFAFADEASRDGELTRGVLGFLVDELHAQMRREAADGVVRTAGALAGAVDALALAETTSPNRRLLLDRVFFELSALSASNAL